MSDLRPLEFHYPLAAIRVDGNMVQIILLPQPVVELSEIKKLYQEVNDALGGRRVGVLLDTRQINLARYPESVLRYAADNEHSHKEIAYAIVVDGIGHRLMANFYLQLHRPKTRTSIFAKEEEAKEWLQERISEDEKKQ